MRVLVDGRVRRTEAEWRGVVERFERSGLSISAFCARAKLSRSSFVAWRRQLGQRREVAPSFVEWVAPASVRGEAAGSSQRGVGELELMLPGGVVLRWRA